MTNIRILLLAPGKRISTSIQECFENAGIACQFQLADEWPWHDPQLMAQKLRQSGAGILLFTGLIESTEQPWDGIQELAECCHNTGIALFMCSTNEVFSSQKGGLHSEKDEPEPNTLYGAHALAVEKEVQSKCPRHLILRTGWLFSGEQDDLLTYAYQQASELRAPAGLEIAPLHTQDFAEVVVAAVQQCFLTETLWGTYHYSSSDRIDLYHFYESVLSEAKQDPMLSHLTLIEDETIELPTHIALQGGLLSGKKILHHFGIKPKPWRSSLARTLKQLVQQTRDESISAN